MLTLFTGCGGGTPKPADNLYFVHTDHLGTPAVITDKNQVTVWQGSKLPFGETDLVVNQIEFNVRFPGQYYDAESGMHYNYFRDYDPAIGRYVQSDPIGLAGGLNTYGYVYQNPLIYTDPTGEIVPQLIAAGVLLLVTSNSGHAPTSTEEQDLIQEATTLGVLLGVADAYPGCRAANSGFKVAKGGGKRCG